MTTRPIRYAHVAVDPFHGVAVDAITLTAPEQLICAPLRLADSCRFGVCHHGYMNLGDGDDTGGIALMGDPLVTAIPVSDNGEKLC